MLGCSDETIDADVAQEGVETEELCPANVTLGIDGNFTWTQTAVGELAFSKEICSSATSRAGWPLAFRFCNVSSESPEQVDWGSVHVLGCSEDIADIAPDEGYCPDGWDSYGAYCYFVNGEHRVNFNDAVFACQNLSSNITSIHSEDEQYYHMLILRKASADLWIGLHGSIDERSF
ncbi:uncharacterized protein [Amphiura filiformis]|uniref:uncharacterized protein n=1 Tax=Amphiura filiformis TaxID=82378 RepID=UPI003B2138DC